MVQKAEGKASEAAFDGELADTLDGLLARVNGRDTELVRTRLEALKGSLRESLDGTFDQLFGGSVAKHTYVDGLSDIDSLFVINDSELEDRSPQRILEKVEGILQENLGSEAQVSRGTMAVTVEYQDGMVIQLLPAIKTSGRQIQVPSRDNDWSKIDPVAFQAALTKRNQQCSGKLVPTIKLAKAIAAQLPASQTLTGYHMESLAIAAFRGYDGEFTTRAMLPVLFERGKDLVLSPIEDKSGQSIHVDEYLGPANSEERQVVSHLLGRIARRMKNATASGSIAQWEALFGEDE
ncbi:MAG: CBASS oligonucleotide cyclase [Terracidiphilus sp.]|jgi:hypothetical protein